MRERGVDARFEEIDALVAAADLRRIAVEAAGEEREEGEGLGEGAFEGLDGRGGGRGVEEEKRDVRGRSELVEPGEAVRLEVGRCGGGRPDGLLGGDFHREHLHRC